LTLDLKFAPLVTLVHCYVFTKLEVSTAFQTDWVQRLMQPPSKGGAHR